MSDPVRCMNPECTRTGVVRLTVFGKPVGMVCRSCLDALTVPSPPRPAA